MKLRYKNLFFALLILFGVNIAQAYELTTSDEILINRYTSNFINEIRSKEDDYKNLLSRFDYYREIYAENGRVITVFDKIENNIKNYFTQIVENEKGNGYESSTNFEELNVDISRVKEIWLGYYNDYRKSKGLSSYSYELILDNTAQEWSDLAKTRGYIDHRRNIGDSYYNYSIIENWFTKKGVTCKNVSSRTFTENIGYGTFKCSDGDCTDELSVAIKKTFNFFVNEGPGGAHYESVVNKYYNKIGLGIAVQDFGNGNYKYYLTTHYCTELVE